MDKEPIARKDGNTTDIRLGISVRERVTYSHPGALVGINEPTGPISRRKAVVLDESYDWGVSCSDSLKPSGPPPFDVISRDIDNRHFRRCF